jgi:hypothetical protein
LKSGSKSIRTKTKLTSLKWQTASNVDRKQGLKYCKVIQSLKGALGMVDEENGDERAGDRSSQMSRV